MPLLSGSISVTRYNVVLLPEEPDFEKVAFHEIEPGSEVRDVAGFVPMEPGAPYQVGHKRFAFRARFDSLRAEPTAVKERLKELVVTELEMSGAPYVGPKKRKKLRELAEEELIHSATPRSKIVEAAIDGDVLYVATTAKSVLGRVTELLRRAGVVVEPKTPWLDRGDPDIESDIVETFEPGESVLGCRFLKALLGDRELMVEPENGLVRLKTAEARVTLSGAVRKELYRYVEEGAEILSAKLISADSVFTLDALPYRLSGLRVETHKHDHWHELLDERLERIAGVFEMLDGKYGEAAPELRRGGPLAVAS